KRALNGTALCVESGLPVHRPQDCLLLRGKRPGEYLIEEVLAKICAISSFATPQGQPYPHAKAAQVARSIPSGGSKFQQSLPCDPANAATGASPIGSPVQPLFVPASP